MSDRARMREAEATGPQVAPLMVETSALQHVAAELSDRIARLDRERRAEVRPRLHFKILRDLGSRNRPADDDLAVVVDGRG